MHLQTPRRASDRRAPVARPALDFVDAREVVLEVEDTEEEGHYSAELEADWLRAVEVFFHGATHAEDGDEEQDEVHERKQAG